MSWFCQQTYFLEIWTQISENSFSKSCDLSRVLMTPSVISPNSPDQTCPQEKQLPRSTINSWLCEKKWQSWHSPDKELILSFLAPSSFQWPQSALLVLLCKCAPQPHQNHTLHAIKCSRIPFTNFSSREKPAVSLTSMWRLSFHPYSPPSSLTVGLLSGRWHWALELWSAPNKKTKLQLSVSHPNPPTFTQLGHLLLLHTFYFWASFTFVHILLVHTCSLTMRYTHYMKCIFYLPFLYIKDHF